MPKHSFSMASRIDLNYLLMYSAGAKGPDPAHDQTVTRSRCSSQYTYLYHWNRQCSLGPGRQHITALTPYLSAATGEFELHPVHPADRLRGAPGHQVPSDLKIGTLLEMKGIAAESGAVVDPNSGLLANGRGPQQRT